MQGRNHIRYLSGDSALIQWLEKQNQMTQLTIIYWYKAACFETRYGNRSDLATWSVVLGFPFVSFPFFRNLSILEGTREREPHQSCPRPSEEREALGRLRWLNPRQCIAVVSSFWCKVNTFTIKKNIKQHVIICSLKKLQPRALGGCLSIFYLSNYLSFYLPTYQSIWFYLSVCSISISNA